MSNSYHYVHSIDLFMDLAAAITHNYQLYTSFKLANISCPTFTHKLVAVAGI
jgi:hypothetical protein